MSGEERKGGEEKKTEERKGGGGEVVVVPSSSHHLEVVEDLGVHTILVRQPRQRSNDIFDNKLVHVYLGSGMWGKR